MDVIKALSWAYVGAIIVVFIMLPVFGMTAATLTMMGILP